MEYLDQIKNYIPPIFFLSGIFLYLFNFSFMDMTQILWIACILILVGVLVFFFVLLMEENGKFDYYRIILSLFFASILSVNIARLIIYEKFIERSKIDKAFLFFFINKILIFIEALFFYFNVVLSSSKIDPVVLIVLFLLYTTSFIFNTMEWSVLKNYQTDGFTNIL